MRKVNSKAGQPQGHQHAVEREAGAATASGQEPETNWANWWPFDRATGAALQRLNRKPKQPEWEEALL